MRDIFKSFNEFPDTQLIVPQLIHVLKVPRSFNSSIGKTIVSLAEIGRPKPKMEFFFFNNHENWLCSISIVSLYV